MKFRCADSQALQSRGGFTLLELATVLLIMALLVGGVLAGKQLIRSSEIRKATSELQTYSGAVAIFRTQYDALPGDFTAATETWGSKGGAGNDAVCASFASRTLTCSGNGNGLIDRLATPSSLNERPLAWQHLALARMIEGSYTGFISSPVRLGEQIPTSRLETGAYTLVNIDDYYPYATPGRSNGIELARFTGGTWPNQGLISPREAYDIDRKIDDGKASGGALRGFDSQTVTWPTNFGVCVDGPVASAEGSVQYLLDSDEKLACRVALILD